MTEKDIPIDIHTSKLLDWLISRRHCNREWQKNILTIRQKISSAIQDMPVVEEIAEILSGTYITYFHCCRIVEVLKRTESTSKNLFGQYSSQRMKDWLEIIKLYEKDNAYLAEAAQMFIRNVSYEIPSLKRQILKCVQLQEECQKKELDYVKSGNDMITKYFAACKQIGIEGKNVRKELISLLDDLPEALSDIANNVKMLKPSAAYYLAFLEYSLNRDCREICLPLITHIMEKGNTTVYEWRIGEQPDIVEVTQPLFPLDVDNRSATDDQVDFGDFLITSESGDDRSSSSPNGDFIHIDKNDCKADSVDQIDFGTNEADISWDITVEAPHVFSLGREQDDEGRKVARGEDALSVLENPSTRSIFYNELLELQSFLEQQLIEMKNEADVLSSNLFQFAANTLHLQSASTVEHMLCCVKEVSSQLMSAKLKHLYLIKESAKYVDRLADSLKDMLDTSEKMLASGKMVQIKGQAAADEQRTLDVKINLIIKRTKELQFEIESQISKRYKNRPVKILGAASIV